LRIDSDSPNEAFVPKVAPFGIPPRNCHLPILAPNPQVHGLCLPNGKKEGKMLNRGSGGKRASLAGRHNHGAQERWAQRINLVRRNGI
jgi:hypothetical protein